MSIKLLADENFPRYAVDALREEGYDVVWIRTESPGIADEQVLERAMDEERVLITFDKDFGEMAFHQNLPADCGIILFRITTASGREAAQKAVRAVNSRDDWHGHFSVVDDRRVRMRELPR